MKGLFTESGFLHVETPSGGILYLRMVQVFEGASLRGPVLALLEFQPEPHAKRDQHLTEDYKRYRPHTCHAHVPRMLFTAKNPLAYGLPCHGIKVKRADQRCAAHGDFRTIRASKVKLWTCALGIHTSIG